VTYIATYCIRLVIISVWYSQCRVCNYRYRQQSIFTESIVLKISKQVGLKEYVLYGAK